MIDENIIGKIVIWYEDTLNFGVARVIRFHSDGGILEFEEHQNCLDTYVIAVLDDENFDEYGQPQIIRI